MSEKKSKRSPYWFRDRNNKTYNEKKTKLEYEQQAITSNQNKFENCSFVNNCRGKAEKKKNSEDEKRNSKISMRNSHSGL